MTANEVWILKVLLGSLAVICGVLGGIFTCWEALRNEDHGPVRDWFRAKWEHIRRGPWLHMPETAIGWLLAGKAALPDSLEAILMHRRYAEALLVVLPICASVSCYINWGRWPAIVSLLLTAPWVLMFISTYSKAPSGLAA